MPPQLKKIITHIPNRVHSIKKYIPFWSHYKNCTFQKRQISKRGHSKEGIPFWAHFYYIQIRAYSKKGNVCMYVCMFIFMLKQRIYENIILWSKMHINQSSKKNTFKKEQNPKKVNSILITFHFYHITITPIPKLAHSKNSKFQKKAHYILITFKKYHIPNRAHSIKESFHFDLGSL